MKKVLITGASSGIGLQLARDYIENGDQLIACGRNLEKLHHVLPQKNITNCVFDTSNRAQTQAALGNLPAPDLAIFNAGSCEYVNDADKLDAESFERVISTNVLGTINCLATILPKMKRGSHVAIVSSSVTFLPLTRAEAYGASKAALDYLARTLAVDLHDKGIHVTLVRPGFVDTPLTRLNDFPMPGQVTAKEASRIIRKGLQARKSEISFPFLFISVMRILSWLPNSWWQAIAVNMRRRAA